MHKADSSISVTFADIVFDIQGNYTELSTTVEYNYGVTIQCSML